MLVSPFIRLSSAQACASNKQTEAILPVLVLEILEEQSNLVQRIIYRARNRQRKTRGLRKCRRESARGTRWPKKIQRRASTGKKRTRRARPSSQGQNLNRSIPSRKTSLPTRLRRKAVTQKSKLQTNKRFAGRTPAIR